MKKYLVLIHFASKLTRENMTVTCSTILSAIKKNMSTHEAVLTSDSALAFAGTSKLSSPELFRELSTTLFNGDNLSVIEIGNDISTSHLGLRSWSNLIVR